MFNLDNFDLDIDDDFSSNIFSNVINSAEKNAVQKKDCSNQSKVSMIGEKTSLNSKTSHKSESPLVKENVLKRPCSQNDQPQKKRLSNEGLLQRKFPGPAGLLPDKPFKEISSLPVEKLRDEKEDDLEKPIVYSQSSGSVFQESSYQKLLSDFNLTESKNTLNRYTVEWLKKTALSKGLHGRKVPFLGLVIHSVNHSAPDPVVILRDPTGEIHGSLHREVWADMGGKLRAGIALALRQVGVLITGVIRRQVYLNITMNNILALYSPSENENQVEITTVNKISKLDLLKNVEQWLPQPAKNVGNKTPTNPALFATVNDLNTNNQQKKQQQNKPNNRTVAGRRNSNEILADLGIVLSDGDFNEEMNISGSKATDSVPVARQGLSQAESLIFEEVLSGIDLNEFEN